MNFEALVLQKKIACIFFCEGNAQRNQNRLSNSLFGARFMGMAMLKFAGLSKGSCGEIFLLPIENFWTLNFLASL